MVCKLEAYGTLALSYFAKYFIRKPVEVLSMGLDEVGRWNPSERSTAMGAFIRKKGVLI